MRYTIKLIGYNVFSLFIFFILSMLFKVPFRWWISIAMTTSSYIVYNYLKKKREKERKGMILYQIIPFLLSVNPSECVWRFDTKCQSCINVTISKKVTENSCFVGLLWVSNKHVDSPYLLMAKRI